MAEARVHRGLGKNSQKWLPVWRWSWVDKVFALHVCEALGLVLDTLYRVVRLGREVKAGGSGIGDYPPGT